MASSMPAIPRWIFTVIEPISVTAGFIGVIKDPEWFIAEQVPYTNPNVPATLNSRILAWQLGNAYLLLGFIGLSVFLTTSEVKVIRAYLFALWLGDIGHVFFSCYGLGLDTVTDPSKWNSMFTGNVLFTVFLFLSRTLYLLGVFGRDKQVVPQAKKRS